MVAPILAPLLVFWEGVTGRRLIAPGDGHTYYLPLHTLVADRWLGGSFPGWDAGTFSGSPLFAVHQSAALHPTTMLRMALPPVVGHNLSVVAALVVAGVGAYVLTHRMTNDHVSAAVAGCAFGLCGFQFAHLGHVAVIATTAWLPWALWAADRLVERGGARRIVIGSSIVALAALSGHGQMLAYVVVATAGFTVISAFGRKAGRDAGRAVARVAAMVAIGGALAAVQLLPVMAALGGSDRSGLTRSQATAFSHDPGGLLVLIFPFLYGNARPEGPVQSPYGGAWTLTELGGYVGAAALVLAVVGLARVGRDRRLLALVVIGGASVLVALGDSTPLGQVVHALPGFGQMRSWARYTVGAQLAVAVLAGVGVARVRAGAGPSTIRACWLAGGCVVVAGLAATVPALAPPRVGGAELLWAVGAPAVAALLAVAVLATARRHPAALIALIALVSIDAVAGFGWWFRWRTASPSPAEAVALLEGSTEPPWGPVPDEPGGVDRYLWAGDPLAAYPHAPRVAAATGASSVTGMDPLAPAEYLEVTGTDYWGRLREPSHLLGPRSHLPDLLRITVVARPSSNGTVLETRSPALSEAFLVGSSRRVEHPEAVAAVIGEAPLDPSAEAVVEQACDRCPSSARPGPAGSAGPVERGPSGATVDVDADRVALLVLSQAWSPGWSAIVDGRPAPVVRANGVVQAVPVPAGRSTVELRYVPPGLRVGAGISGLTVVVLGGAWVVGRRRAQRQLASHSRASSAEGESSMPVQIG
ncbi:hypothetical protein BH23ACT2_BH23ACT2_31440 [soil metagenome]